MLFCGVIQKYIDMKSKNINITPELIAANSGVADATPERIAKNVIERAADEFCTITPLCGYDITLICHAVQYAMQQNPGVFPVQSACDALTRLVALNTNVARAENPLFVFANVCAEISNKSTDI